MRGRYTYVIIAIMGVTIALLASYSEWASVDLSRHSFREYLSLQPLLRDWWTTVGIPLFGGVAYVFMAAAGPAIERKIGTQVPLIFVCLLFALALLFGIGGVGYYATIVTGVVLLVAILSRKNLRR
jgi:hypothetical protein